MYVFEGVIALRDSARHDGRELVAVRRFHGAFPPRINLLVDLDSVARAEPDVWNRHTMDPVSKMTENGLLASRALGILLISTANPSHSSPIATSLGG